MIGIVDYGLGNVNAFGNIYKRLNIPFKFIRSDLELNDASHLILPGVGTFDYAIERINSSGMRERLDQLVLEEKIPILGVCIGMQIMGKKSEEGNLRGLCWLDADIKRLENQNSKKKINLPHLGWNNINIKKTSNLINDLDKDAQFYFLHSYYFSPNKCTNVLAESDYGMNFPCAVMHENIFGVQFHPEKSHSWGVQILKNFSSL